MIKCPACQFENIDGSEECDHCGADLTFLSRPRSRSPVVKTLFNRPVSALRAHPVAVVVDAARKVRDVIASLVMHREGCAVIVGDKGQVIGVFSEHDLVAKVAGRGDDQLDRPVGDFMTPDPVTIDSESPIAYALHQMDVGGYRHLPLVKDGVPVGMVSVKDILMFLEDRFLGEQPE